MSGIHSKHYRNSRMASWVPSDRVVKGHLPCGRVGTELVFISRNWQGADGGVERWRSRKENGLDVGISVRKRENRLGQVNIPHNHQLKLYLLCFLETLEQVSVMTSGSETWQGEPG
jgi:hypothetical protein